MTISPVRRTGFLGVLRGLFRPRPLAWFVGLLAVTAAVEALSFPLAETAGKLLWLATAGIPLRIAARRERELHAAERLHRRQPRRADPERAPRPTQDASSRRARSARRSAVGIWAMAGVFLAATPFMALYSDSGFLGLPPWSAWVVVPLVAAGLAVEGRGELRRARRGAARAVEDLPRSMVTVLGFTGFHDADVVLVPGEVTVPTDASTGTYDVVLAGQLGPAIPDLVPGDVLVCDGRLEADAEVFLSDGTASAWTGTLRVLTAADLAAPESFAEAVRQGWADADGTPEVESQLARERRFEEGLKARQAAFEQRLSGRPAPPEPPPTPPWGTPTVRG